MVFSAKKRLEVAMFPKAQRMIDSAEKRRVGGLLGRGGVGAVHLFNIFKLALNALLKKMFFLSSKKLETREKTPVTSESTFLLLSFPPFFCKAEIFYVLN